MRACHVLLVPSTTRKAVVVALLAYLGRYLSKETVFFAKLGRVLHLEVENALYAKRGNTPLLNLHSAVLQEEEPNRTPTNPVLRIAGRTHFLLELRTFVLRALRASIVKLDLPLASRALRGSITMGSLPV